MGRENGTWAVWGCAAVLVAALATGCAEPSYHIYRGHENPTAEPDTSEAIAVRECRFGEPTVYRNLAVYPLLAEPTVAFENFQTLDEALEAKTFVVGETGEVNTLVVENRGGRPVFIHAGDIVRGGRQDRMIPNDMVLPPKSGKVPVESFCVESGRWSRRGGESDQQFSSSKNMAYGKTFRTAAADKNQSGVWSAVSGKQSSLRANLGAEVRSEESPSSLELTMNDPEVKKAVEGYVAALESLPKRWPEAVGVAIAIDGDVYGADAYACPAMFRKIWPKLLRGLASEALAAEGAKENHDTPTPQVVRQMLAWAEDGQRTRRDIYESLELRIRTNGPHRLFRTIDTVRTLTLHDSYVIDPSGRPKLDSSAVNDAMDQIDRHDVIRSGLRE